MASAVSQISLVERIDLVERAGCIGNVLLDLTSDYLL